jgi:TonB family protein
MGTARWSPPDDRSPWRTFVTVSVVVHAAAVAFAALLILFVGRTPGDERRPSRGRAPVTVALLEPDRSSQPVPIQETPAVPGTFVRGTEPVSAVPLTAVGRVPAPPTPTETSPLRPAPRIGTTGGPRPPTGGPARTVIVVTAPDGALDPAGPTRGGPAAAGPGDPGGDPGGDEPPSLVVGPQGSPLIVSLGSTDPRFADYLGAIAALLEPEWRDAFPRERALYMQQGEVVLEWTVEQDGSVRRLRVLRPSGVPPFDRNVVAGFERAAARFPAPPSSMPLPIRIRAPYRYQNPMFD